MIREGPAAVPALVVQPAVTPRSSVAAFVPKRRISDAPGHCIGEIERDAPAARQHVRIDRPTERLAEPGGDVPPGVVQICQGGIHPFAAGSAVVS